MKKALLVIDVQNEYFTGMLKVTYPDTKSSLHNILRLMETARKNHMPVIVVQHTGLEGKSFVKGTDGWELHPLLAAAEHDYYVEKTKPSSFYKTQLEEILQQEKITDVVITGYMTQMCCDTTAREAFHKGYSVEFIKDATGTIDVENEVGVISGKDLHHAALMAQSLRFSKVISTEGWLEKYELNS